jgi:hypothetical protein
MMNPYWISSGGNGLEMNGRSDDWLCMGFTGLDGKPSGSAIFLHRDSRREGAAWYLINQHKQPFYYFSPAYLYLKPIALERGEQLRLQYRVLHLSADISAEMLASEYHAYISKTNHLP